jgi:hypothetical protein
VAHEHAFIQGRHITSNIVIAQEIVPSFDLSSWKQSAFIMFKIDLAKAFDRIEWSFIAQALQHQGFQSDFIDCVHSCITLPTFSVVINGQSFGRFNAS